MMRRIWKILLVILVILLAGGFAVGSLQVKKVNISGNVYYSTAEIEELIFQDELDRNPLVIWFRQAAGRMEAIPFVEKYTITIKSLSEADVIVYEKNMVGYVEFLGNYLYFDRDGTVVESSQEHYLDVPQVTGLDMDSVVLSETLPVSDTSVFQTLLTLTQYLSMKTIVWEGAEQSLNHLVERINFDSAGNVSCYVGDIIVLLGNKNMLEGKLQEMADILPELSGKAGTLHLETYDETLTNPSYIFKNRE